MKVRRRHGSFALLAAVLVAAIGSPAARAQDDADLDLSKMAQKANNPLSDVWLLIAQNDYSWLDGDLVEGSRQVNSLKLQPVMPVPVLGGDWNLIFRPIINFASVPLDEDVGELFGLSTKDVFEDADALGLLADPWGRTTGLGDSVLLTLLGPNRDDGFVWGAGVTQIFPTATEDVLGQKKWQAGPAAIAVRLGNESGGLGIENWNLGLLAQQWWSYAGDSDRDSTSQMDIQYFINWRLNDTQLIGMTPNIRIDWKADSGDKVSLPIGLGTIGMFRLGRMPVRWGVELQYYVLRPDDFGPEWNLKVFFAPIILNPLK